MTGVAGGWASRLGVIVLLLAGAIALPRNASGAAAPLPPVVPGHERLNEAKVDAAARGELLLGELNCLSCHKPDANERVVLRLAPDLAHVGGRVTPQWLKSYLADPHALKPGTSMPNVFHASAAMAKDGAVEALVHYLVSLDGPIKPATIEGTKLDVEAGEKLYHSVGCVACHAPMKDGQPIATKLPSIPLGDLARKTTVDELTSFLLDPHKVRPSGRMPSLLLTSSEAKAIAIYLLRAQIDNPQTQQGPAFAVKGLTLTYWEADVKDVKLETLEKLKVKPKSTGHTSKISAEVPGARKNNWAVRFAGAINVAKAGKYTFFVTSDDGSRVYVGGKQIIDNDGIHPASEKKAQIDLTAGSHPFFVTFFNGGGGAELKVEWQGPGIKRGEIPADALGSVDGRPMVPLGTEPFAVDPQKAQMGQMMFSMLGCAACHAIPGQQVRRPGGYKPLATLNVDSAEGCLGGEIKRGVPNYYLSDAQRGDLKAAVKNAAGLAKARLPGEQVVHTMAALNCYACHKRDAVGGPAPDRDGYFAMTAEFDMGDEGRLPPALTMVEGKLQPQAIEQIVCDTKLRIRPVLATRMPVFAKEAADPLLTALPKALPPVTPRPPPPAFTEQAAKDGRQLFGNKGLGCVNCHGVHGNKSLGMPAPDLTSVRDRLKYEWYSGLLHDPNVAIPGTRMPGFWPGDVVQIKNLGGDTAQGQIDATWQYLSLGTSMALPAGLVPTGKSELIPVDEPLVHHAFFREVGTRTVLVGFPEQLSVAFDANTVRLAEVWRGRFFDMKGMWDGRGGGALGPLGTDDLKLPLLGTFAVLPDAKAPWPKPQPDSVEGKVARNLGGKFLGYDLDKEKRPTFRYRQAEVEIREQPLPRVQPGGATLIRKFELTGKADNFYALLAIGQNIEQKSPTEFVVDQKVTIRIKGLDKAAVRDDSGTKELIIPVPLNGGKASFEVEMSW
jgi:mono/diheme cytochrome c family protein